MATLSVQTIVIAGITPTYAAVDAGGDVFPNDGDTYVQIKNSSGANSYTITFTTAQTCGGIAIADPTVSVGTNGDKMISQFAPKAFNDGSARVSVSYAGSAPATDLTIGVFKHPRVDV